MRQMADLTGSPIEALSGDAVIYHVGKFNSGSLILNVGINAEHGAGLVGEGAGDLVAFGRDYIANPDLVERIASGTSLNPGRPEGYYGSSPVGHTDYPFLEQERRASTESRSGHHGRS